MFTMLSGIRMHNRPYMGTISSNFNPQGFGRSSAGRYAGCSYAPCGNVNSANSRNRNNRSGGATFGSFGEGSKVQVLEIVLDKDAKPVYEPGQEVTGRLVLVCGGTVKFKSLAVSMKGVAKVHWTESRATGNRLGAYREQFSAEIEYFDKKRYLVSACSNGDRHVLTEGRHEFEFKFQLPSVSSSSDLSLSTSQISTSFEGRFGSVRYFISADLDQSWAFTHRAKRTFTVISPIDINTEENLTPVVRDCEKTVCCWLCAGGEVSMSVGTDRKGYCPGESVAIDGSFCNQSSRRVLPEAVLCQTQTFSAGGKTRTKKSKFTILTGKVIASGTEDTWEALLLKIPPVTPSILNCKLIKVEYAIKVSLVIPGSYSLSVLLPIVIGTVPYRRLNPSPRLLDPSITTNPSPAIMSEPAPPYANALSDLHSREPPPSYLESIDADDSDREASEEEGIEQEQSSRFAPLYRYVPDYHYSSLAQLAPPDYAEQDPFPTPSQVTNATIVQSNNQI